MRELEFQTSPSPWPCLVVQAPAGSPGFSAMAPVQPDPASALDDARTMTFVRALLPDMLTLWAHANHVPMEKGSARFHDALDILNSKAARILA